MSIRRKADWAYIGECVLLIAVAAIVYGTLFAIFTSAGSTTP